MFGFGKKKAAKSATENLDDNVQIDEKELQKMEAKMPSGMKGTIETNKKDEQF